MMFIPTSVIRGPRSAGLPDCLNEDLPGMEWSRRMSFLKNKKCKRIIIVLLVCLLYTGAYLFGHYVVAPTRNTNSAVSVPDYNVREQLAEIEKTPLVDSPFGKSLAAGAAQSGDPCPVSFFLSDLQMIDPEETVSMLKSCNVSMISIPLVWNFLEKTEGAFDPSEYDELLAPYVDAGFRFIFLLDGASRMIPDRNGQVAGNSLPDWVLEQEGITRQMDFLDREDPNYGLSYSSRDNQAIYMGFCEKAIAYFGTRYADQIVGFAPCIMNEFEIKYPQTLYAWTDYGISALEGFRNYLQQVYGSVNDLNAELGTAYSGFSSITFPVISYNNTITSGALTDNPLFADFQRYRELAIVEYVSPVFDLIHTYGHTAVAYFGQALAGQDAIYATGVVTRLASRADIAVIDYNFYDGYGEVYDSIIPAMLVNYLHNAGCPKVWAGLYFERIPYMDHLDFLQETVDYVAADSLADGIEIGGMIETYKQKGAEACPELNYGIVKQAEPARIAIYAGEWDFYKSHGEQVRYYNYFSDALSQMYKIIRFELKLPVDILCDEAVLQGALEKYELLVLPGQFYVEPSVRGAIEAYLENGGKALMDFRFGEWNANGSNTGSWSDAFFHIGAREARQVPELKLTRQENCPVADIPDYTVRSLYPGIPNVYALAPAEGAEMLFTDETGRGYGLCTDTTIVLGFQPQIQYKYAETEEELNASVQVIRSAMDWLLK